MVKVPDIFEIMGAAHPQLDPTELRRFLQSQSRNQHVMVGPYEAYLRKGVPRRISPEDTLVRPLDFASVNKKGDQRATLEKLPPEQRPPKGKFRDLVKLLEEESAKAGHDSVYAENIMNQFLPEIFASMGYTHDPVSSFPGLPSMYKRL